MMNFNIESYFKVELILRKSGNVMIIKEIIMLLTELKT
jgi:hypothetical protein